jgi:hypothetical protein
MPDAETPPGTEPEPESDDPPAEPVGTGDDRELGDVEPAPAKLTREQAREQAEAERIERELQAQREALELARADAERQLAGPGLISPDPPLPPTDLEALWAPEVTRSLHHLREDLESHRVGLAISGGGSLGSFEAGVLRFLYDHAAVAPVAVCRQLGRRRSTPPSSPRATGPAAPEPSTRSSGSGDPCASTDDMWEPEPWLTRLQASASWASTWRSYLGDGANSTANAVRVAVQGRRAASSVVPPRPTGPSTRSARR